MGNGIEKVAGIFLLEKKTFIKYMVRSGHRKIISESKPVKKVSSIDKDQAFMLFKEGNPFNEIAHLLGCKERSIRLALNRYEPYIEHKKATGIKRQFNDKKAFNLYLEFKSMQIVSEKMRYNIKTIYHRLHKYGPFLDWKENK